MPLVRSWWLGKKKGKEAWVRPIIVADSGHPSGKRVEFEIGHGTEGAPTGEDDGTVGRNGARCVACGSAVVLEYVRATSRETGLGAQLLAVVAEGNRRRVYLEPNDEHRASAAVAQPESAPRGELFDWPGRINVVRYGLTEFADLFTNRQLLALTTFSDLVMEARERVLHDAVVAGLRAGGRLESGGTDAEAYADAVSTYLGLSLSRGSDYMSSITTWHGRNEQIRNVFARQAIPMAWDYLEVNPIARGSGTWTSQIELAAEALEGLNPNVPAEVTQAPAQSVVWSGSLISTDPPYYPTTITSASPTHLRERSE
jgi:putative DNA methylase